MSTPDDPTQAGSRDRGDRRLAPDRRTIRAPLAGWFRGTGMTGEALAVLSVVCGVLVIVFPDLLAWLVGLVLIVVGVLLFAGQVASHRAEAAPRGRPDRAAPAPSPAPTEPEGNARRPSPAPASAWGDPYL